jgi:Inner membrane protein CreD
VSYRLFAVLFIFVCTCFAWWILGVSIFQRTGSSDTKLRGSVASTWGEEQTARPPTAAAVVPLPKDAEHEVPLELASTKADATLDLAYRQKGLLWYSTYRVDFAGAYTFQNPEPVARRVIFRLALPAKQATYDDLVLMIDGVRAPTISKPGFVQTAADVPAGHTARVEVHYRSQGLGQWSYKPGGDGSQARAFALHVRTNFDKYDVPDLALSPTTRAPAGKGWDLKWDYANLVSGANVAVAMPDHLQPGPVAGRISMFAPVSLLFFFFLMFLLTALRGINLHPMNYFFLAAAFFSFHLLLAYLVDLISIHLAFAICSVVSIFLVVSYLRLVVGMRFALLEAGAMQLVYLVGFSYAFLLEGMTGLAITIGSILTLFLVMQWTGRIRWSDVFAGKPAAAAAAAGAGTAAGGRS